MEGEKEFAILRRVPGLILVCVVTLILALPSFAPDALAIIALICSGHCAYVLMRSGYYAYLGFSRIRAAAEKGVPHPSQVPVQIHTHTHTRGRDASDAASSESNGSSGSFPASSGSLSSNAGSAGDAVLEMEAMPAVQPSEVYHLICICRCTEDPAVLENTVDFLATHNNRERYIILLALEAKDPKADVVGRLFLEKYHRSFHKILYSVHPGGIPGEIPGKSANVSWGVRVAHAHLSEHEPAIIPATMVTVCDCDTLASEAYMNELSRAFAAAIQARKPAFFAPPIMFARDEGALDIPAPVRVADYLWSVFVLQNLARDGIARFPCSCYSVGLSLAASVGFWDTGIESIPEDFHMALKVLFSTNGKAELQPIYHPVMCQHVGGDGWWGTCVQRFLQSKRHMWGVTDVGYALYLARNRVGMPLWERIALCLHIMEMHITPSSWTVVAAIAMDYLVYANPTWLEDPISQLMFAIYHVFALSALLFTIVTACIVEVHAPLIADVNASICSSKPLALPSLPRRLLDWVFAPLIGPFFLTIPCIMAQLKLLVTDRMNGIHVSQKLAIQRTPSGREVVVPVQEV